MGREQNVASTLRRERVLEYLHERYGEIEDVELAPLGESTEVDLKEYGYGRPVRVSFRQNGEVRHLTIRTMTADPFGHDRRADRAAVMLFAYDAFPHIPRHIRPVDVGAFDADGRLVSLPAGEPFLVTEYVDGRLYAADLREVCRSGQATPRDLARAWTLADYLAELHQAPASRIAYERSLRDMVGSGEGIFGLCDAYLPDDPVATPARLEALEHAAVTWRWRLRTRHARARRTHGDFHPFNLLFRGRADLSVLDCSRGAAGDPADDLAALSINYLFFARLTDPGMVGLQGPLRRLWDTFWARYLEASGDQEVLEVVAPFFAWRTLVVICPIWYPEVSAPVRDQLLSFAERLMFGARFTPDCIDELLR